MVLNYKTLIADRETEGSIRNLCNDSRVPATVILKEAQDWIYQRLRVRQMMARGTSTLAANADTIALSTFPRYRAPIFFMFTGTASLAKSVPRRRTYQKVLSEFSWDGSGNRVQERPQYWATDATNIQFETQADQAYPCLFAYYAGLADLGPNEQTNFLTDDYTSVLTAACLFRAYEHLQNERWSAYWRAIALREVNEANVESDEELAGTELEALVDADEINYA